MVSHIARRLVGSFNEGAGNLVRRFASRNYHGKYVQVGGDFGDAWTYGGAWKQVKQVDGDPEFVHIGGLEGAGVEEIDSWDIDLPDDVEARLRALHPEDDGDDQAFEDAEEEWKQQEAEKQTAAQTLDVYRFTPNDDPADHDWTDAGELAAQWDEGVWDEFDIGQKWEMVYDHHGWENADGYPDKWTKAELCRYLGIATDKL